VGIVAGRLRERYRKPAIVLGIDRNANVAKGSGRSQPGVNLGEAVRAAYAHGLLLTGGGHQMAAGLTMRPERIPDLRDFLAVALSAQMDVVRGQDALDVDVLISPGGANVATVDEFARLAPFGQGNPEPIFAMANVNVEHIFPMKGGHVRCDLTEGGGMKVRAVAWRVAGSPIGERLMAGGGGLHMAGRLRRDSWNGRVGVQFEIEDVADRRRVSEG
jgi:single-stranded-DNA-specific exonuclease